MSVERQQEVREGVRRVRFEVSRKDEEELDWYVTSVVGEGA